MSRMNKARYVSGKALGGLEVEVGLEFHKIVDYDRKQMRAALNTGAAAVRKEARRLLQRRSVSGPGEIPGRRKGNLSRAIGVVSRGTKGGWVKVAPRSIKGMVFYPAFLFYGSKKTGLEPRANYMEEALQNKASTVREEARAALRNALVPR